MMAKPRIQCRARETLPQPLVVLESIGHPCRGTFDRWPRLCRPDKTSPMQIHHESVWNRSRKAARNLATAVTLPVTAKPHAGHRESRLTMSQPPAILVFDSGLGGLTVL